MRKKALITGVNGFIGRAFWQYIKKRRSSIAVYGLDIKADYTDKNIFSCDLQQQRKLNSILTSISPDYIFHFAGGRMASKRKIYESNFLTTKYLLEAVEKVPNYRPRIIIPGSAAEYGKTPSGRRLVKESDLSRPLNYYGTVKLNQTNLSLLYAERGLDIIVARMFNISGAGAPSTLVVGKFVKEIVEIEKGAKRNVICTKNLDGKRDFLDIDDICQALLMIAQNGQSGKIYNICSSRSVSIRDVLGTLLSFTKIKDITVQENKKGEAESSFDVIGSNARLKSATRWSPKISMEKSLKNTLQSYRATI